MKIHVTQCHDMETFLHCSRKLYVQLLYDRKNIWVVFYSCILPFNNVSLEITVGSFHLS